VTAMPRPRLSGRTWALWSHSLLRPTPGCPPLAPSRSKRRPQYLMPQAAQMSSCCPPWRRRRRRRASNQTGAVHRSRATQQAQRVSHSRETTGRALGARSLSEGDGGVSSCATAHARMSAEERMIRPCARAQVGWAAPPAPAWWSAPACLPAHGQKIRSRSTRTAMCVHRHDEGCRALQRCACAVLLRDRLARWQHDLRPQP